MTLPLRRFPDGPPPGLLELPVRELLRELRTTTWLRLPGTGDEPARAVATLLHGDEPTGLEALLRILRRRRRYPFDLHVVVGNVEAALHGSGFAHRFLDGQEDGNRVWDGASGAGAGPQRRVAAEVLGELLAAPLAGLVDLHNTTGANPFHAIVACEEAPSLDIATRFSTTLLRWDLGVGTLLEAVAAHAPVAAVECGLPGRHASTAFAVDGLRRFLGPPPPGAITPPDHDLIGDLRKVVVRPEVRFRFGSVPDREVDLVLAPDGDAVNLRPVAAGHVLGHVAPGTPQPLQVTAPDGTDLTESLLAVTPAGAVVTREPTTPVMVVRTVEAVRKDCLCYLASTPAS